MVKREIYIGSPEPDPTLPPGFRVHPDKLSNEDALRSMSTAVGCVLQTALDARQALLSLGFADDHSLCEQLDATAREYAVTAEVLRRQEADPDADT